MSSGQKIVTQPHASPDYYNPDLPPIRSGKSELMLEEMLREVQSTVSPTIVDPSPELMYHDKKLKSPKRAKRKANDI